MAESASAKSKKKKKDKKAGKEDTSSVSTDAAATSFEDGALRLQLLPTPPRQSGAARPPVAVIPGRDAKRAGLVAGDPLLVQAPGGRRSVATCEVGRHEAGLILAAALAESIGCEPGDQLVVTGNFEARDAAEAQVEVPEELATAWPALVGGGLQLDRYILAAFDSTLLFSGDLRTISVNGRSWSIRVVSCSGASEPDELEFPHLISKSTRLTVSVAVPKLEGTSSTEGASKPKQSHGLSRIGGLRAVVDELREAVQMPLERPEIYRQMGVSPPRGVLLYGPPGTGKTLLAKSLAEELQCPVELCSSTDLVGGGVGEAEDRIRAIFERCRNLADARGTGALLFIDEIDAVCPKRDDSGEAERRMVAAFLVALDGVRGSCDGVVVLGATNRPDSLDPALRRAGRLEREIEVGVPNTREREQILNVHLASMRHSLSDDDVKTLSRRCHGYVGADIRALCAMAARSALRDGRDRVDVAMCLDAVRLVPPSALKEMLVEVPEVRWGDIGGYEGTKEALREAVEWPIRFAWAFESMSIDPPRGVLLYGPPGCSKTMMAKAVATETEMNFVSIKGPELFSKYVGDSERAVREVFRKARAASPCVVFFDEIDAVGASREGDGAGGVAARVLTQLLAEMDGIGAAAAASHVVVLAATNRPQVLDPALTRPGRFDRLVHVPLPDAPARQAIFKRQLSRMRVDPAVDAGVLAGRTEWYSGAEVVMVCREAAMLAIREALEAAAADAQPRAGTGHFERALGVVRPRIDRETVRFYEEFEQRATQR